MVAIVTRAGKGSPLTNAEVDANFTNLNNGKLEANFSEIVAALGYTPANKAGDTFTGDVVFDSKISVGTSATASTNYRFGRGISGGTSANAFVQNGNVQSGVTGIAVSFNSQANTAAAAFTLSTYQHFLAQQGTIGAGSAITNVVGFNADASLVGSTATYGFRGQVGSGAGRWNLFMDGAADNHIAGALGIGTTTFNNSNLRVGRNITGATSVSAITQLGVVQSGVTTDARGYTNSINTAAAAFVLPNYHHYIAQQGTLGAGSTVTAQSGFTADAGLTGATNNYGFRGQLPSGSGRWNLFMDGTAANFLAGATILNNALGFGASGSPSYGTSGQFLKSGGSGAVPTWAALTSGEVTTALGYTPLSLAGGTMTGLLATCTSTVNTAHGGSTSTLEIMGSTTAGAVFSLHRAGAYAVNIGLDSDNVFRIGGWSASANRLQMDMSGNLTMAGNVTAFSDERLKKDWTTLPTDFLQRLVQVKSGTYTRIDSGERQAGVSAQDMQAVLPEAVIDGEHLSLAYGNAALVAVVELAREVLTIREKLAKIAQEE